MNDKRHMIPLKTKASDEIGCSPVTFFSWWVFDEFIDTQSLDEGASTRLHPDFQLGHQAIQNLKWDLCFTMYLSSVSQKRKKTGLSKWRLW